MKTFSKIVLTGLICLGLLATSVHGDRATLADNDWHGMTSMTNYMGSIYEVDDLLDIGFLRQPMGVLLLRDGTVVVADSANHTIKAVAGGEVSVLGGNSLLRSEIGIPLGTLVDGTGSEATFNNPIGMAEDSRGNIYVADAGNHSIRKIDRSGAVTTVAGDGILGYLDGDAARARFYYPSDIAIAPDGTIYVADTLNHVIRKIDVNGQVTTLNAPAERYIELIPGIVEATGDFRDGPLEKALFNEPSGLAIDEKGNLYVSDSGNQRIRYIDFDSGTVSTVAGSIFADPATGAIYEEGAMYATGDYVDGPALEARLNSPKGIALTDNGGLLIADSENHAIRYLKDGQLMTVSGLPGQFGNENGIEQHHRLYRPVDVAVSEDGSMFIADSYNNLIRLVQLYKLPENFVVRDEIQVIYDGQEIRFERSPEAVNGRTMVQVRFVAEALGYEVSYEENGQKVTLQQGDKSIEFHLGQRGLIVREGNTITREILMDVAPYAEENRTYVPVRFFAEVTGKDVAWIQDIRTVIIRDKIIAQR